MIKTATTGGASSGAGLGPRDVLFEREELEALVDEAHKRGRRVMCHALGGEGLRMAVEVGVNSIEHGSYLAEDPELLRMMADKGICFTPTFGVYTFHATRGTPHGRERASALREHHVRSVQMALEHGVTVTAGTDEGGWEHANNAHEISCLVEAGLTPMQAIVAATSDAADCVGQGSEIGSIEAGKKADIILVDGNPLEDVTILERGDAVRYVMKDGVAYLDERASLVRTGELHITFTLTPTLSPVSSTGQALSFSSPFVPGSSPGQALSFSRPFALSLSKGPPFMVRQAHHERNTPRRQPRSFPDQVRGRL